MVFKCCRSSVQVFPVFLFKSAGIRNDWGMKPFSVDECHEVMELVELRYGRASTMISGQLPPTAWRELFPDPTVADAIVDRLVHNAFKFNLAGESMRKTLALRQSKRSTRGTERTHSRRRPSGAFPACTTGSERVILWAILPVAWCSSVAVLLFKSAGICTVQGYVLDHL